MYKKLLYGIAAITALFHSFGAEAQDLMRSNLKCRIDPDFIAKMKVDSPRHGASAAFTAPASFPASAIDTCGKFQVFYADEEVFLSTGTRGGFANLASGATRRNTMCSVLQYIQSRFDFSKVPSGEYVRLYVDTSYSSAFPAPTLMYGFLAVSSPFHKPLIAGDTVNGFVNDFVTTGIDSNVGDYHAYLRMNFDKAWIFTTGLADTIMYNDGIAPPSDCLQFDLYSTLLHYVTHTMGWFSWADSFHTAKGSSTNYTNLDLSMHKTPLLHTVSNPFSFLSKAFPAGVSTSELCWVNGKLPPDNYLMHKGLISHFIQTEFNYFERRNSPGDEFRHVMQAGMAMGNTNREYTKADWETLHNSIGYKYNNSFETDSASIINNHLPFSRRMGSDVYNTVFVSGQPMEYLPNDYVLKNNVGASISINLNSLSDLNDLDGDSVFIYPNSLVNFRGCGISGNNHNLLNVNTAQTIITYTPRANFYGRAQFGFNLTDKKGKGGFVIFTIDVTKGNNVSVSTGANLALNGDFEEGSEVKTNDTNLLVNNTIFFRYPISQHYSDSHPLDYSNDHFGTAIRNAYQLCRSTPSRLYNFGHQWNISDFSAPFYGATYTTASPYLGIGNRYQPIALHTIPIYLGDTLKKCQRYLLEFDASHTLSEDPTILPYPKYDSIIIGFARDTFFNPTNRAYTMIQMKPYATDSIKLATWKHMRIPFTYCRDSSANIITLFIKGLNGFAPAYVVDNVKLTEVNDALAFKLKDTATGNCARRIFSDFFDLGCSTLSYSWRKLGSTSVIATTSSLVVNSEVTAQYVLTISDGCYSGNDTITITPCPCSVGAVFGATKDSVLPASTSTSLSAGIYHLTADLLVTGTPTFSNALILIEPNVKITVASSAKLTIDNSHLFVCPDTNKLWKGIELATGAAIEVKGNTLIEDAVTAIDASTPSLTGGSWIINTDGAIFNRNRTDISISDYNLSTAPLYPFQIINTVFTNRHLSTFAGYPNSWPSATALKTTFTNTAATAPYEIDRDYAKADTKDKIPFLAAIKLKDVGTLAGTTYSGVVIGGLTNTTQLNLFDNTGDGIVANNSNVAIHNNTFINMSVIPPSLRIIGLTYPSGAGVIANNGFNRSLKVSYFNGFNVDLFNKFYDCITGVRGSDYSVTQIDKNYFHSSNSNPKATFKGIDLIVSRYDSTIISNNELYNIPNSIYLFGNTLSGYSYGQAKINNNKIQAQLPMPVIATGAEFVTQGIEAATAVMSTASGVTGYLRIIQNELGDVYNGIKLNNFMHQKALIMTNNISLKYQSSTTIQVGVHCANNTDALVYGNNVIGLGAMATDFKKRAFYNISNKLHTVDCNSAKHIGRGFDFSGIQPRTFWRGNTMENNLHGMALGGPIDQQGAPSYATLNQWQGFWSIGASLYQTLCYDGANPAMSILFVKNNTLENPISNWSFPSGIPPKYGLSTISITPIAIDDPCATSMSYAPRSGFYKSLLPIKMKMGMVDYGSNNGINAWMGQMSLWRAIHSDDSFVQYSNNDFAQFATMANTARFGWLTDIEDALGNGNTNLAQNLLNNPVAAKGNILIDSTLMLTDTAAADYIVANYIQFYSLYLQYSKGNNIDSIALAELCSKCPRLHGEVIYQARALFTQIYGTSQAYNDDSCSYNNGGQYRMEQNPDIIGDESDNSYSLFPNPNNGSFTIQQKQVENKLVNLKVYNATGALVYKNDAVFKNGQIKIQMSQQSAGLYLVCIGDAQNKTVCLRFLIK